MKNRRLYIGVVGILLAVSLVAFSLYCMKDQERSDSQSTEAESIEQEEKEVLTIGCTLASAQSNYQEALGNLMETCASSDDSYVLDVQYAQWNVATQEQQMESFIEQEVDAIILCPVNAKSFLNVLREARNAGIPVINLNMKVDMVSSEYIATYVGASMSEEAEMAAKMAVEYFDGQDGKIAIIEGRPGSDPQIYRTQTFLEKLQPYSNLEVVGIACGEWEKEKAKEVAKELLEKNPDIDMFYCHDNYMAQGVCELLDAYGITEQVAVIGIGGTSEHFDAVEDGRLYGFVTQPPEYEAEYALKCAKKAALGEELRFWYKNVVEPVTLENLDELR